MEICAWKRRLAEEEVGQKRLFFVTGEQTPAKIAITKTETSVMIYTARDRRRRATSEGLILKQLSLNSRGCVVGLLPIQNGGLGAQMQVEVSMSLRSV